MRTIEEALKKGARVKRCVLYYADLNGVSCGLESEARYEYLYNWRKKPKKRRKKK